MGFGVTGSLGGLDEAEGAALCLGALGVSPITAAFKHAVGFAG